MQFLEKKRTVHTEDSISANQNTNDASQIYNVPSTSQITTSACTSSPSDNVANQNTINETNFSVPSISETAAKLQVEQKKARQKRKRNNNEDADFEKEMLKMFQENSKLMQNDDMAFFSLFYRLQKHLVPIKNYIFVQRCFELLWKCPLIKKQHTALVKNVLDLLILLLFHWIIMTQ